MPVLFVMHDGTSACAERHDSTAVFRMIVLEDIYMASDQDFIDYIIDQLSNAGSITFRKMFGEYALYVDGKVFALVCDNQLFIKPTDAGKTYIGTPETGLPYPGAKPYFVIQDKIDDSEWLCGLVVASKAALPEKKMKKPRKKQQQEPS